MYYPYFVAYMAAGFVIGLVLLIWALKTGQFSDQERARFLPLEEEPETPTDRTTRSRRTEIVALGVLVCAGLAASAMVLLLALMGGG